jgi:hypothetical protein
VLQTNSANYTKYPRLPAGPHAVGGETYRHRYRQRSPELPLCHLPARAEFVARRSHPAAAVRGWDATRHAAGAPYVRSDRLAAT